MPLSPSQVRREALHTRAVTCHGYRRDDGLWDIEGRLTDVKSYAFDNRARGRIEPGTPLHGMWLRLTMTDAMLIVAVEAVTDHGPYAQCGAITPHFQRLIGLQIGAGWRREVRARVGGVEGCTHLAELLGPLATTAFQTIFPWRLRASGNPGFDRIRAEGQARPVLLDTCHVYDRRGAYVREHWPDWAEPEPSRGEPA